MRPKRTPADLAAASALLVLYYSTALVKCTALLAMGVLVLAMATLAMAG